MSQTKKPLPVCDTESGSGEQCVLADIRISETEYTIPRSKTQCIADLLLCGEKNAVPLQHLEKITGLDQREIRRMIRAERLLGTPILSNNLSGYYLPGNDAERERCVASLRRRAAEIRRAADAIERSGSE